MSMNDAETPASSAVMAPQQTTGLPWVEKYRPRVLSDVVGNESAVNRLRAIAQQGNLPHIIISGPPGTGKTTSIMCLANEMLGPDVKEAVLELNASDSRGIDVVRSKIKSFAQKKVTLPAGKHKIVILDEADSMTKGAQQALRRTMEMYSKTTRFALACNISSKIIEPIQSRCAIIRFSRLDDKQVIKRIREVMELEHVTAYDASGLEALAFTAQGDMRQALNNLQSTYASTGAITGENVFKVVDQPHPHTVIDMLRHCHEGHLRAAIELMEVFHGDGYAAADIVSNMFKLVKNAPIPDMKKANFIREIGDTHLRVADGCDSLLQLTALLARLCACVDGIPDPNAPVMPAGM